MPEWVATFQMRREMLGKSSQTLMPQKWERTRMRACHIVYKVETELEADGRWIAEIVDVPGVIAYGATEKETVASAQALALRILADRIEQQKEPTDTVTVSIETA